MREELLGLPSYTEKRAQLDGTAAIPWQRGPWAKTYTAGTAFELYTTPNQPSIRVFGTTTREGKLSPHLIGTLNDRGKLNSVVAYRPMAGPYQPAIIPPSVLHGQGLYTQALQDSGRLIVTTPQQTRGLNWLIAGQPRVTQS